ncbi:MAG: MFS transporter [Pseudomonadales bacterium]|nr:MFS transporter [Pseudomonadales bacterium]
MNSNEPYPRPGYAWMVVVILLAAYILSFIDRDVLSLLVGELKRELALDDKEIGWLLGAPFALFYATCGIFIAWLADRGSRKWVIFTGVALWSIATVSCGFASTYSGLFVARIGVAVGEAALTPPALSLLKDYFPPERIGRAIGLYTAGVSSGAGIANIIGGSLLPSLVAAGAVTVPLAGMLEPWQLMFVIVGLPGFFIALLITVIREPVRRDAGSGAPVSIFVTLAHLRSQARVFVPLFVGLAGIAIMGYGVNYWIPEFFRRTYELDTDAYGYFIRWRGVLLVIFGLIGVVGGGWLCDILRRKYDDAYLRVALIGYAFLTIGYTLLPLMPTPQLALLMVIPATLGGAIPTAAGAAAVLSIAPANMRAQITAVYYFTLNLIGFAIGPIAVAWLTEDVFQSDDMLRYSLAIVAFVAATGGAALIIWTLRPYRARVTLLSPRRAAYAG